MVNVAAMHGRAEDGPEHEAWASSWRRRSPMAPRAASVGFLGDNGVRAPDAPIRPRPFSDSPRRSINPYAGLARSLIFQPTQEHRS